MGLNLTAADTVIHFDLWWNPAGEDSGVETRFREEDLRDLFAPLPD